MSERKTIVSGLNIEYEGLFDSKEFLRLIDDWLKQHGYDKNEQTHVERVREKGKYIHIDLFPTRDATDYVQYELSITIEINDLVEANIKKGKTEFKINKGKVSVDIDATLITDYQEKFEENPMQFFFRTIFDKFIHKEYTGRHENAITKDVQDLHTELKSYLNLERFVVPS